MHLYFLKFININSRFFSPSRNQGNYSHHLNGAFVINSSRQCLFWVMYPVSKILTFIELWLCAATYVWVYTKWFIISQAQQTRNNQKRRITYTQKMWLLTVSEPETWSPSWETRCNPEKNRCLEETRFPGEYEGIKVLERGGEESRETKMEERRGREKKEREKKRDLR